MRAHRLFYVAGWVAVLLLAVAGFAAFNTGRTPAFDLAASSPLGRQTGAYAGLSFAVLAEPATELAEVASEEANPPGTDDTTAAEAKPDPNAGTIAAASTGWLSEVQVRDLVSQYFERSDVNLAVRIAWCESRFNPKSINHRTGAVGLFQHLPKYWSERASSAGFPGADPQDPVASTAAAAWEVYHGGGWDIFNCRG